MAIAYTAVDLNQAARDAVLKVARDFQELAQSASTDAVVLATAQTNVTNMINALFAAGAVVTHA